MFVSVEEVAPSSAMINLLSNRSTYLKSRPGTEVDSNLGIDTNSFLATVH